MDDRRFDSLTKALASGANRRGVLKGLLGLGGAALAGSVMLDGDSEAARRPTATRTPIPKCPGSQTWNSTTSKCECPAGQSQCAPNGGPACCNETNFPALHPQHSECCDNACCFGTCYGEELCCPTNALSASESPVPPTHRICETVEGPLCCSFDSDCCSVDGCCDTFCYGGTQNDNFCCPAAQACPGSFASNDICCDAGETCCGGGTNANYCADLSTGGCCQTSDCPPPEEGECGRECVTGHCQPTTCPEGQICCQGDCVSSSLFSACPVDPDECCSTTDGFICCGPSGCCLSTRCNEVHGDCCASEEAVCRVDGGCCTPPQECCLGDTCCDPESCSAEDGCCTGDDIVCGPDCCPEIRCGINAVTGGPACCPEEFVACGTICCSAAIYQCATDGPGCECKSGTEACGLLPGGCCPDGKCNLVTGECCDTPGESPCGETCCLDAQCNDDSICCPADTTACGEDCCIDGAKICNETTGTCECPPGAILCGSECTFDQCCVDKPATRCVEMFGYDLECVTCSSGFCETSELNGTLCLTDDSDEQGKCANGDCVPCSGPDGPCDLDEDCCSGLCMQDHSCSDQ